MSTLERAAAAPPAPDAAQLYERHGALVRSICAAMLRDREEAADAAQQTFLSAHRALLAGSRPEDAGAWLATIARNECRQRTRRGMAAPATVPLDPELDGRGDTTFDAAVRATSVEQLREAVAALPERQREALLLRDVRGLSYEEVATAMATTPPAVETLLVRARRTVSQRVRVVPDVALGWVRELLLRLGGPADAVSAGALAAKGATAVIAAMTATGAAVEVQQRADGAGDASAAIVRVDNSGPGSASSGQGRGRGRGRSGETSTAAVADSGSGHGRGRGRGRSGEGAAREAEAADDSGGKGRGRGRSGGDDDADDADDD